MQNIYLRNEFLRSFCSRFECDPMFWRLQQNSFVSLVRLSLFRMFKRALTPKFAIPFLMRGALRWMPVIRGIPCRSKGKHVGTSFPVGSLFPRNSVMESRTVATPYLFLWVPAHSLGRVSFHTYLFKSTDLLLSIVRNIHCFFFLCPQTCPWLQLRQKRAFQVAFNEKRNASHDFSAPRRGPPSFFSLVSSRESPCEQYLECKATATALAVLTVEADDKKTCPAFPRLVASSSR